MAPKMSAAMIDTTKTSPAELPTFGPIATTPRAPYIVPRRKLMFERPVDLKEAAESGRCVEDELDLPEEKTGFVIKVLICK